MANEGFDVEEWDTDFLNQLVQAEELALTSATQHPHQNPSAAAAPPIFAAAPFAGDIYSPPRELSQRVNFKGNDHSSTRVSYESLDNFNLRGSHESDKDDEIYRLKEELGRVSKQLTVLDEECSELRKERDRKEEQLKHEHSRAEANDAELGTRNSKLSDPQSFPEYRNANFRKERIGSKINAACKAAGVQTDYDEPENPDDSFNSSGTNRLSKKLYRVWYPSELQVARNLVLKVLVSCEADICVLLGIMNSSFPKKSKDCALVEPTVAFANPLHSAEAAKISHFHFMLTKFSDGIVTVGELLEALVSLCRLKNVSIVHSSLHILHAILKYSLSIRSKYKRGTSVDGSLSYADEKDWRCNLHWPEPFMAKAPRQKYDFDYGTAVSFDQINWISLFELICQIVSTSTEDYVRQEAISIMNIIVIRSDPYLEREKFGSEKVFQCISPLLRKEAGLGIQTRALRLLHLLLNCPKIMSWFCTAYREEVERSGSISDVNANSVPAARGCVMIFEGLAHCISCSGIGSQELKLRRNAIILLAFLASSGNCGFEILFSPNLSKNLLAIILRGLTLDMDLEAKEPAQSPEVCRDRTLLMREALILLNGLASHPQYSGPVLRALTHRRDMVSLTIDIAKRLTVKADCVWKDDNITRQIRESEILELARAFKKRVYAFFGDIIS